MTHEIAVTGFSRIPFVFGPVLCWVLWEENVDGYEGVRVPNEAPMSDETPTGEMPRDFGVFEGDAERRPLLIRIDPPQGEELV